MICLMFLIFFVGMVDRTQHLMMMTTVVKTIKTMTVNIHTVTIACLYTIQTIQNDVGWYEVSVG